MKNINDIDGISVVLWADKGEMVDAKNEAFSDFG